MRFGGVGDKQRQIEGNVLVKVKYEQDSINILNFNDKQLVISLKIEYQNACLCISASVYIEYRIQEEFPVTARMSSGD